jgi:hypothetical protein
MKFDFTGTGLSGRDKVAQRLFEALPGATSWFIIIGMSFLAFYSPISAALIIIAFYLYWLFKLLYLTIFLLLSYGRLSLEKNTDWMERIKGFDDPEGYLLELSKKLSSRLPIKERLSLLISRRETGIFIKSGDCNVRAEDIHHLVVIPIAKETRDVLMPGIIGISKSTFPRERIVVVLAVEERASSEVKDGAWKIKDDFKEFFRDILVVMHPAGIEGETMVKGANTTYASKKAAEYFEQEGVLFENVIVSCFDSDTVVSPQYFACLSYHFMVSPGRLRMSFQPIPVYNNNIWEAPGITRVLETGSSFFQLIEFTNEQTLVTFSSHSMSFKALTEVGYWPVDMISDDSAIYWKSLIHYDGDYKVVPMYVTLSMDAVTAETWWKTAKNVYKQRRRWAWGVEDFPIVMRAFLRKSKIPLRLRIKTAFKLFEGHISWTTWAFLLTIIGWLPALFATKDYSRTVAYYSIPRMTGIIFHLASISLITSIVLSLRLLPPNKSKLNYFMRVGYALQWLLIPVTLIFLSALPALDAQTRMMFGKKMTFWVTDKERKNGNSD